MSDTRGETIRHNMQKNTCIFVKHVKKLTLPPVGESAILVKHEKMRTGLSVQPGKAKKDNDKVSCFAQGGSGGTAGQKRKA